MQLGIFEGRGPIHEKGHNKISPQKICGTTPFRSKESDMKRAIQKGHFRSFAE